MCVLKIEKSCRWFIYLSSPLLFSQVHCITTPLSLVIVTMMISGNEWIELIVRDAYAAAAPTTMTKTGPPNVFLLSGPPPLRELLWRLMDGACFVAFMDDTNADGCDRPIRIVAAALSSMLRCIEEIETSGHYRRRYLGQR